MPQEAINYISSLPEFVAEDFERITGIDVRTKTPSLKGKTVTVTLDGQVYEAVIK